MTQTQKQGHTPGPWRACDAPSNFARNKTFIRPATSDALIATVSGEQRVQERWANARLIAAAPDLLAALTELLDASEDAHSGYIPGCGDDLKWSARLERVRIEAAAAIAKAEGRS